MAVWEQVLLGVAALVILLLFWPGVSRAIEQSRKATGQEWMGLVKPLAVVVVFVIVLILLVRG